MPSGIFSLEQYALASQLGLPDEGGEPWKTRRFSEYAGLEYRDDKPVLVSRWKSFADVTVTTVLIPLGEKTSDWHLASTYQDLYGEKRCKETSPPNKIIGDYDTDSPEGWVTDQMSVTGGWTSSASDGVSRMAVQDDARPSSQLAPMNR